MNSILRLFVFAILPIGPLVANAADARPNIVFILADDLGCMDVGALMPSPNPGFKPVEQK